MYRIAFTMQLLPGFADEYKRRHDEIWTELQQLLKNTGIEQYSIFIDEKTNTLFAYLQLQQPTLPEQLATKPVMKQWWAYMKDIMVCHEDHSPVTIPLKEVFYLP